LYKPNTLPPPSSIPAHCEFATVLFSFLYFFIKYTETAIMGSVDKSETGFNNHKYDPDFTNHVINLMSPETLPRHREILSSLIKHLHDFCRDVELTQDEWIIGVNYVNSIGQAYKKNRNEAWRVCDVLGVESYVPFYPFYPFYIVFFLLILELN
jgi:hypothetical protein